MIRYLMDEDVDPVYQTQLRHMIAKAARNSDTLVSDSRCFAQLTKLTWLNRMSVIILLLLPG